MKIIYKYQFESTIMLPEGAKIISVQIQRDKICLWAELDTDAPLVERKFQVFATGDTPRGTHINTIQDGPMVWHVYEVTL